MAIARMEITWNICSACFQRKRASRLVDALLLVISIPEYRRVGLGVDITSKGQQCRNRCPAASSGRLPVVPS